MVMPGKFPAEAARIQAVRIAYNLNYAAQEEMKGEE